MALNADAANPALDVTAVPAGVTTDTAGNRAVRLIAGAGDDLLDGGGFSGSDIFFFNSTNDNDTIINFDTESDILLLRNTVTDFTSFQYVLDAARFVGQQADTPGVLIDLGGGHSVLPAEITLSGLVKGNKIL